MNLALLLTLIISTTLVAFDSRIYFVLPIICVFGLLCKKEPLTGLAVIVLSIGTPIYIRVLGRDAASLTTILIFVLFFISIWNGMKINTKLLVPAFTIVLVYLIDVSNLINNTDLLLQALRFIAGLTSGFMLLLSTQWVIKKNTDLIIVSRLLLLMVTIQSIIALIQIKAPNLTSIFTVFSARDQTVSAALEYGMFRAKATIGSWELLAEWIAGIFPLGMFFLIRNKRINILYVPILLFLIIGLLSSVTRGAIVALIFTMIIFMTTIIFSGRLSCMNIYIFSLMLLFAYLTITIGFKDDIDNLLIRFGQANYSDINYQFSFESLATLLNRNIWFRLPSSVSINYLLGNGYLPFQENSWNIHSLYFTIWYQTGIIGSISWAWILFFVVSKYIKLFRQLVKRNNLVLLLAYIMGLIAMLLSEVKVEFLRLETTIQFFLLFIGLGISIIYPKTAVGTKKGTLLSTARDYPPNFD